MRGVYDVDHAIPRAANGSDRIAPPPALGTGPTPGFVVHSSMRQALAAGADDNASVTAGDLAAARNNPDSAALLGSQPPHRNSSELVAMALRANALTGRFVLDTLWDRPTHPEGWYSPSDHLPYVRVGVPALMYTTNLHNDYHTPRDNPVGLDYPKLLRMSQWMYVTGWCAANAAVRPAVDPGFRLER